MSIRGIARSFAEIYRVLITPRVIRLALQIPKPGIIKNVRARPFFQKLLRHGIKGKYFRVFSSIHPTGRHPNDQSRLRGQHLFRRKPTNEIIDYVKWIFLNNVRYNASLVSESLPDELSEYVIGNYIAQGCNGAVYELRVRRSSSTEYPLALKMLFNYDFSLPESHLWEDFFSELIPLSRPPKSLPAICVGRFRHLPRVHPNVVKIYTAFVDKMPLLENAHLLYPDALPLTYLLEEPKTLFVVMKRYRMTLREYLNKFGRKTRTNELLFGQLLEGLSFIVKEEVVHRDLKSDNILLEFDADDEPPMLVISDFGTAMYGFNLQYVDELTDLGGNIALRAPEIRNKVMSSGMLNFEKADVWSAGAIGIEIFTRHNPFYRKLSSANYMEEEIPKLPEDVPIENFRLIKDMLRIQPHARPTLVVAANTVCMSLFRLANNFRNFAMEIHLATALNLVPEFTLEQLNRLIALLAAETVAYTKQMSRAELQLRASFFSRLNTDHILQAISYFKIDLLEDVQTEN